jgi:uncharacterized protein (DUF4415 family)
MSDWNKIRAMRDAEAEKNAGDDPDNPPTDENFWADAELHVPDTNKIPIHIKISPDILNFFKKDGPGYQTRINQILEQYVKRQQQRL